MTKTENILAHYSVAKADSNYEKNRQQISFDFPLKNDTEKSHDSTQNDTVRNFGKTRISRRKRNQKRKYFYPLVSGARLVRMMKKSDGTFCM